MTDYRVPLDELPDPLPIEPLPRPFDITIRPPGSKSITNRAYILAALARGESRITRPLRSEDTDGLLDALCTLGAEAAWVPNDEDPGAEDVLIKGVAGRFPRGGSLNLGDGGTPTRFMIAAACLAAEPVIVDGSTRMRERPVAEGVDMLRQLGATIEYIEDEGRLPVRIVPSENFKGGDLTIGETASSQFISAVMLIAPFTARGVDFHIAGHATSVTYIVLSTVALSQCGLNTTLHRDVNQELSSLRIDPQLVSAFQFQVEADASSAAYWFAAPATITGSRVTIESLLLDSVQPDMGVPAVLTGQAGFHDEAGTDHYSVWSEEPLRAFNADGAAFPDGTLALAAIAALADATSTITGLQTLRVKETDRLAALANELCKVGCAVETTDDSITITPPRQAATTRPPIVIETYNDHRMAMSFAILGLARPGISIANPGCVAKSYPTFWQDFARLYEST